MRIFVLGVGGAGSLLAHLLQRQGHTVWCGDRDPDRARKFLGKKSKIEVKEANARNLWSIVRAARGCNLIVNASPAVFNEIILRAALRLRIHYVDLNSHLNRNPFPARTIPLPQTIPRQKSRGSDLHGCGAGPYQPARETRVRAARYGGVNSDSPV